MPNKRLRLTGGDRFRGSGVLCAGAHGLTSNLLRRRAGRPQLKRDPLGGMLRTIVLSILGAALVLTALVTFRRHRQDGRDQVTIRRGDSIAAALEQFARAEHRYPDSLRELVPRYLPSLPPPGPSYQYWRLWRPLPGSRGYMALESEVRRSGLPLDSVMPRWELTACTDGVMTCSPALYRSSRGPTWIYEN